VNLLQKLKDWLQKKVAVLPTIPAAALADTTSDDEYLYLLVEAYERLASPNAPLAKLDAFTNEAAILLLFSTLKEHVENGGFIQLIQNGYGPAIFDSPLGPDLARWGAIQTAALLDQARAIYQAHRAYLERPRALAEFSALYKEFTQFEPLENQFYDLAASQTASVRAYVAQHLRQFARVA
jgi:hypothetical protein